MPRIHLVTLLLIAAPIYAAPNHDLSSYVNIDHSPDLLQPRALCPDEEKIAPCSCEVVNVEVNVDCSNVTGTSQLDAIFATTNFPLDIMNRFSIVENSAITSLDADFLHGIAFRVS